MTTTLNPRKLWEHPNPRSTHMYKFMVEANEKHGTHMQTFEDLYQWSTGDRREQFWEDAWIYFRIIHEGHYKEIIQPRVRMDEIPRWFSGVRLNFAENILYSASPLSVSQRSTINKEDDREALTEVREGCTEIRRMTFKQLRQRVGLLASAMRHHGVRKGDRCAVVAGNGIDTCCVFLAVTSLGGIFSSSSTDMGPKGILDRLLQVKPRWVFMDDGALYNGKTIDLREKMVEVVKGMEGVREFQGLVSVPRWREPLEVAGTPKIVTLDQYLSRATTDQLEFERVNFHDPYLVVYSSGTTGQPKCIVHSTGGYLLSLFKEGILHRDGGPHNTVLQYTTTGWIMYLYTVSYLSFGARSVLYDGSPFQPDVTRFIKLLGEEKVTNLGVSPRWFQTVLANNIVPRQITDLSSLRCVSSTGMVLPESLFEWFYDVAFPSQTQLCNISGGTDIAGCFGQENPLTPLYCGGCQGPSLGTLIDVFDQTDEVGSKGKSVAHGTAGELVATKSFPNMPVMLWPGDKTAKEKYFSAYFEKFDNVWTHGDFVQIHPKTKQIVFLGRADGVLNPSGVRFGSAEIYNVIEKQFPKEIVDSIVVGQRRPHDDDESVMLFLKMQDGVKFSQAIVNAVNAAIAKECSKRHVPKYTFETPEIPTTVNLKKVELPVKHIVSGRIVKPSGTLLNPDSLNYYYRFAKDEELQKASRATKL